MTCPRPRITRTGEAECPKCGLSWGPDEPPPNCSYPSLPNQSSRETRIRTRQRTVELGNLAIENIRLMLRKDS